MAVNSYPNINIASTTTTLNDSYNGSIIVSTYAGAVSIVATSDLAAGFKCKVVQYGGGTVTITAGSSASLNGPAGATGTSAQYAGLEIVAVETGKFIITGNVA